MVRARSRLGDVIVAEDGTLTDKLDRSQPMRRFLYWPHKLRALD